MQKVIDINSIEDIKKSLEELGKDDVLYIEEEGDKRYVFMPIEEYLTLDTYRKVIDGNPNRKGKRPSEVKVISNIKNELTYEEYEKIKEQLMDVFEKTFRPSPEKLN